jgi:hypothetical protein
MDNLFFDLNSYEYEAVKRAETLMGGKLVGRLGLKNVASWYHLFNLSDYDQHSVKHVAMKPGEAIFRYTTRIAAIGGLYPLIKINFERRLIYFLTQESLRDGYVSFESRGVKVPWLILSGERREAA